jgi:predicted extracellular nuclease
MKVSHQLLCVLFLSSVVGCTLISPLPLPGEKEETGTTVFPTPTVLVDESGIPVPGHLVISEFLPGVEGNNNYEYIELYNAGTEPIDLTGWSIWYRMADNQDEKLVYQWKTRQDIPGYGHYLLVREGQDIGIFPDATFSVPLFEKKGGLVIRNEIGDTSDALGWGDAPSGYYEGIAVHAPGGEGSLNRKPGGEAGNGQDSGDNASDFNIAMTQNPQNLQDEITPLPEEHLLINLQTVDSVLPGTEFKVDVNVRNSTADTLGSLEVVLPIPVGLDVVDAPPEVRIDDESGNIILHWLVDSLPAEQELSWTFTIRSPWSYDVVKMVGYYVESPDYVMRRYGKMIPIFVEGGSIPIETARTLAGQVVTVEGIATMYTGGYYAGSTGTKFYVDDGTGGIQVYCPDGMGVVYVDIGDKVRITGLIEVYRDSIEIIPEVYPDHVEILEEESELVEPLVTTGEDANSDASILGRLITVEGQVTRLEEFAYSFELDLIDKSGNTVLVYLDKESYIDPEFIDIDNLYKISGILELYNTVWQLKPRLASDFVEVFPEELMAEMTAQNSIEPGGTITYTITAYNHTPSELQDIVITAEIPGPPASLGEILDEGELTTTNITWNVPQVDKSGGKGSVRFTVVAGEDGIVDMQPALVTAEAYPDEVTTNPWLTFIGSGVPIWAIQGDGFSSPFVRTTASTEGVVTGIFQELQGFWIQSLNPDDNPSTSEGLFVSTDEGSLPIVEGDLVVVKGKIREKSGQTQLSLESLEDIVLIDSGLPMPEAQELNPPAESDLSKLYYEALEGMLVKVTEPGLAIAPVSKYGEYVLVTKSWDIDRIMRGEPNGMMVFVDDGSAITHYDQSTLPYVVKTGDFVGDIIGPLAYTYENYKIQPLYIPTVIAVDPVVPKLPALKEGEISIATFNAENMFDIMDPHPSDPPRPSINEYRLKIQKVAETITTMGAPTVIGFQEVENISILEDLAENEFIATYGYIPALLEGLDSRGIDVGYLVRGDQADIINVTQHPAPEGLTSRPPLVIEVNLKIGSAGHILYVINNHFTSMSAGELATEPQRNGQAAWNVTLAESILAENSDANIVVLGDLNSFYDSPPIDTLRKGGFHHVYEYVEPDLPYTYVYQGVSETLDHILVTPSLWTRIRNVKVVHTNADYPPSDPEERAPFGVSDHDPLIVVFTME